MYEALNEVIAEYNGTAKVFGDIGCYTLGALPPFRAIDSCIDMGASITMAKAPDYPAEAAEAFCRYPHIVLAFYGFRHLIRSADTVLHP